MYAIMSRDHDGKVTPEEVATAAMYLKDTLGKESVQELISNLSRDTGGKILLNSLFPQSAFYPLARFSSMQ